MGFLESLFGLALGNAYIKKQAKKEEREYENMITGLNSIQKTFDSLDADVERYINKEIEILLDQIEIDMIFIKKETYMPIILSLFNEIMIYSGKTQDCHIRFLSLLISKYPFAYILPSSDISWVYSYSDAFNYDNRLNGNLQRIGNVSPESYAWYQIYKDSKNPYKKSMNQLKDNLHSLSYQFHSMPFLLKDEEYPLIDDFIYRINLCEPTFELMYKMENNDLF